MLSVRKAKGFRMVLNFAEHDEVESFTLIHLNEIETELFLNELGLSKNSFYPSKMIYYKSNDSVDLLFKRFALEHKALDESFENNLPEYTSDVKGKWCLLRNPDNHTIRLKSRGKNDSNSINRLCIDANKVSRFCADCKRLQKESFLLSFDSSQDEKHVYSYWSDYMTSKYKRKK